MSGSGRRSGCRFRPCSSFAPLGPSSIAVSAAAASLNSFRFRASSSGSPDLSNAAPSLPRMRSPKPGFWLWRNSTRSFTAASDADEINAPGRARHNARRVSALARQHLCTKGHKNFFDVAPLLLPKMSRCASRKHGVDGGEQIRRDGSFEDKCIGSRLNRGQLRILFLVWTLRAISFSCGKWLRNRRISPSPSPASQRRDQPWPERRGADAHSLHGNFIPHHHNRLELCLKQAAYAFHQAKMPICQKRTTSLFCRHLLISRSPPRGVLTFRGSLDPERVSMTSTTD